MERTRTSPTANVDVSVIVPVSERPASLTDLYQEYAPALAESGRTCEFIFAVEPWHRNEAEKLRELAAGGAPIGNNGRPRRACAPWGNDETP